MKAVAMVIRKKLDKSYYREVYEAKYENLLDCLLRQEFFATRDGIELKGQEGAAKEIEDLKKKEVQIEKELKFVEAKL